MKKSHLLLLTAAMLGPLAHANCWQDAGQTYRLDPWLLYSIAKKESKMKVHAVNRNPDGSEDLGLMQINSSHLRELSQYGITREMLLNNPCLNINVGAWVLSWNVHRHGYTKFALGAYNAGAKRNDMQEQRREAYANSVLGIYREEMANIK